MATPIVIGSGGIGFEALRTLGSRAPTSTFTATPMTNVPIAQYTTSPTPITWLGAQSPGIPSTIQPTPVVSQYDIQQDNIAKRRQVLAQQAATGEIDPSSYDAQMRQLDEQQRSIIGTPGKAQLIDNVNKYRTLEKMGPLTEVQQKEKAYWDNAYAQAAAQDIYLAENAGFRAQSMQAELMSLFGKDTLEKASFRVFGDDIWSRLPEQYQKTFGGDPYYDAESFAFQEQQKLAAEKDLQERFAHMEKMSTSQAVARDCARQSTGQMAPQPMQPPVDEDKPMDIWEFMLESQKLSQDEREAELERQRKAMEGYVPAPPQSEVLMGQIKPYLTAKNIAIVFGIIVVLSMVSFLFGGSGQKPVRLE